MKAIITALTGLILTATVPSATHAAAVKANRYVLASKAMAQSYTNLVVRGDIEIILVQGTSNQLTMEGYQSDLENVNIVVKGQTLYVSTKVKAKGQKKPVVYIPVTNLSYMRVEGNSNIKTLGYLQSPDMLIELASECHVAVKSTGKITISENSTADYVVEKWVAGI